MNDDRDIEEILNEYRSSPRPEVKHAVLSRFRHTYTPAGGRDGRGSFWRKPIPLYAVLSSLILLAALSFFAGRRTHQPAAGTAIQQESNGENDIKSAEDIPWVLAQRDLM
jgi:anti-sigma-K factor RskA